MEKKNGRKWEQEAMQRMSQLNEQLTVCGYTEREREELLVRILLCFFAGDTGVFSEGAFFAYLAESAVDGSDLAARLNRLFHVLAGQKPEETELGDFSAISPLLFEEEIPEREMDAVLRLLLLDCQEIPWGDLSPAIFGAMFQEIMNQQDRREWGAYYTSEENIHRVIDPLFLEDLQRERESCRGNRRRLAAFQRKLAELRFLDPACGCGNFLILTYRCLRELELSVISELHDTGQRVLNISMYCKVSVSQFYGIEVEPFQARIARVCLWLAEQQMNRRAAERFGVIGRRDALVRPVVICEANALATDWAEVVQPEKLNYIIGNPPFVGARLMNAGQKQDMKLVFRDFHAVGNMDYVTAWYRKAAEFIRGTAIRCAFVSTNSICQGEQAALLWKQLAEGFDMAIDFAWKSFVWNNGVRSQARVHCVILGFSDASLSRRGGQHTMGKWLCSESEKRQVPHINAYLVPAPDTFVLSRRKPLFPVPEMVFGNMANDDGNLILTAEERGRLLAETPELHRFIRPFLGSVEFIQGKERYCLWLTGATQEEIASVPEVAERVRRVGEFRSRSRREGTRKLALTPERFGEIRQPEEGYYILVPRVSSVRRSYIPMGFVPADWIASDAVLILPGADLSLFAVLTSRLHMVWVQTVAGRLKSDYRYSVSVVYNNFPFPSPTDEQRQRLAAAGQRILDVRSHFTGTSLAALYDPDLMPQELAQAHRENDLIVEEIYGVAGRTEEEQLVELLRRFREKSDEGR